MLVCDMHDANGKIALTQRVRQIHWAPVEKRGMHVLLQILSRSGLTAAAVMSVESREGVTIERSEVRQS